jgi:hypothetical protein
VKFGVGRYLYRLPAQWVDYDPHKRQFVKPPQLPKAALPKAKQSPVAIEDRKTGEEALTSASQQGRAAMTAAWKKLSKAQREACIGIVKKLGEDADAVDRERSANASASG